MYVKRMQLAMIFIVFFGISHVATNKTIRGRKFWNFDDDELDDSTLYYNLITPEWFTTTTSTESTGTEVKVTDANTTTVSTTKLIKSLELSLPTTVESSLSTVKLNSRLNFESGRTESVNYQIDVIQDSNTTYKLYTDNLVIAITPASLEELNEILQFEIEKDYNFWSHRRVLQTPIIVLLPPNKTDLIRHLREHRVEYKIMMEDIEMSFKFERKTMNERTPSLTGISFNMYLKYDFIMDYLKHLSNKYAEFTKLITIGQTVEKRDIVVLQVHYPQMSEHIKGAVLIEAGMHAREWLSVSAALYAINQLVEHAAANFDMFPGLLWYILPVFNADGYVYAHTYDRLWKANRNLYGNATYNCSGIDLDRNFDIGLAGVARKALFCTSLFGGFAQASEPETQALQQFIKSSGGMIKAYISLHSGDTFIAYPWAYKTDRITEYESVMQLAKRIKNGIEQRDNSSQYVIGSLSSVCGLYDGSAVDWAYQEGVLYSLMVSLKGSSVQGFDIAQKNVYETVVASFDGIRAVAQYLHIPQNITFIIERKQEISVNRSNTTRFPVTIVLVFFIISFLI